MKYFAGFTLLILSCFVSASPVSITRSNGPEGSLISTQTFSEELGVIAEQYHNQTGRCGGFIASFEGEIFNNPSQLKSGAFLNYSIERKELVRSLLEQVSEPRLLSNIIWFSSYPTRYYLSSSGVKAMQDLHLKWAQLVKHLNFAKVELVKHKHFSQPSVVLTFQGVTADVIVLGGHGDSINKDDDRSNALSPGADDNASGISVLTEVIQVLSQNDYKPQNTIKFMAYAAEEVGLLGSMDISGQFEDQSVNVLGVIQFDGTNYKGSKDLSMVLFSDHTNQQQNLFLGSLIDTYLKTPWRYDQCGYACSDSYSWTYRGFPASFPGESRIKEENPKIHTSSDTLEVSNNKAIHSVNFAKLGLAYVIELDK